MKKSKFFLFALLVVILIIIIACIFKPSAKTNLTFTTVKNQTDLNNLFKRAIKSDYMRDIPLPLRLVFLPTSLLFERSYIHPVYYNDAMTTTSMPQIDFATRGTSNAQSTAAEAPRDYSTTNLQVENVDEADIIKTDGNYIYSLVDDAIIITDVNNTSSPSAIAKITLTDSAYPEDILLNNDKLVAIGSNDDNDTIVNIFDLTDRRNHQLLSSYELPARYFTSRLTDGKLLVMSNSYLYDFEEDDDDEIEITYELDNQDRTLDFSNIKYNPNNLSNQLTFLAVTDLNVLSSDTKVSAYLLGLDNAYVSEKNVYLVNNDYGCENSSEKNVPAALKELFSFKGVIGLIQYMNNRSSNYNCDNQTQITKFALADGLLSPIATATETGTTINQFSLDEYNGYLRVAFNQGNQYSYDGAKVVIFDDKLQKVGSIENIGKNERMYSTRFLGDRAYLVTYKNTDPLFVLDLSQPQTPRLLGELKIPGYSTYLHPYDKNHLIGIGYQSEETIDRDPETGRVISNRAVITGMKMALFDVTNPTSPKELSNVVIGDSRTTSAILTNHKALLFSREKNLLAIPVNNYDVDFEIDYYDGDDIEALQNYYVGHAYQHIGEGYLVYNIDLTTGITPKGLITHASRQENYNNRYSYHYQSRLLRGLYINNNLYTVSQTGIKINRLDDLSLIGMLQFGSDPLDSEFATASAALTTEINLKTN